MTAPEVGSQVSWHGRSKVSHYPSCLWPYSCSTNLGFLEICSWGVFWKYWQIVVLLGLVLKDFTWWNMVLGEWGSLCNIGNYMVTKWYSSGVLPRWYEEPPVLCENHVLKVQETSGAETFSHNIIGYTFYHTQFWAIKTVRYSDIYYMELEQFNMMVWRVIRVEGNSRGW